MANSFIFPPLSIKQFRKLWITAMPDPKLYLWDWFHINKFCRTRKVQDVVKLPNKFCYLLRFKHVKHRELFDLTLHLMGIKYATNGTMIEFAFYQPINPKDLDL